MTPNTLDGSPFGLDEFCRWLDRLRESPSSHPLLRTLLGEAEGGHLNRAVESVHRVTRAMTGDERLHPTALSASRRAKIADDAHVDISVVDELILRFTATESLIRERDLTCRRPLRGWANRSEPYIESTTRRLEQCRERDLLLWDLIADEEPINLV